MWSWLRPDDAWASLLPGQEVTTDAGHANAFGPVEWVDFRRPAAEWAKVVAEAGGLLSINRSPVTARGGIPSLPGQRWPRSGTRRGSTPAGPGRWRVTGPRGGDRTDRRVRLAPARSGCAARPLDHLGLCRRRRGIAGRTGDGGHGRAAVRPYGGLGLTDRAGSVPRRRRAVRRRGWRRPGAAAAERTGRLSTQGAVAGVHGLRFRTGPRSHRTRWSGDFAQPLALDRTNPVQTVPTASDPSRSGRDPVAIRPEPSRRVLGGTDDLRPFDPLSRRRTAPRSG